nr:reverse transcriptase domain-containing protein [Tanacetum cinerariifolium]
MLSGFFQNQASTLGTLPSNTITNPKGEMKAITTRSGIAYEGHLIPTNPSPKKVVERETKETTDKEQTNFQRGAPHIQPLIIPILVPDVPKTLPKTIIPYPSRLNDQKFREKAMNQIEKFFQIFQDFYFDISFADALLLMPKFASTIKSLLANKDKLFELAKIPLNENRLAMLLKKLPKKLGDPSKFLIPCDFPRMDVNRIDFIDVAREEYAQEMLGFSNNSLVGNPTSTSEPIISDSSPSLAPFEGSDFILEEIKAYLKDESISLEIDHAKFKAKSSIEEPLELEVKDLSSHLKHAYLEGVDNLTVIIAKDFKVDKKRSPLKRAIAWKITDIKGIDPCFCTYKILMEEDYKPAVQSQRHVNPKIHKKGGITIVENENNELIPTRLVIDQEKTAFTCRYGTFAYGRIHFGLCNAPGTFQRDSFSSCLSHLDTMLQWYEDTNRVLNKEKCHFMVKEGIVPGHKIFKNGLDVDRAKFDVIAKLPHPTTVKGVRPMTHLLEKETPFVFSKDCIDAFETLKKKLTEAPILVVLDWKLPFELIGKEMIAVVYAFKKFRLYLVLSKRIVYTDHSALEYLLSTDFMGPFSSSRGNMYILVAADYLSKWVEAKALPTNDARVVVKFLKSLFSRFRTPRAIIRDHGTYFCNDKFVKVMSKYVVTHRLATTYHPQTSGQVEVSNRGLKCILERTVGENRASWFEKLEMLYGLLGLLTRHPLGALLTKKTKKLHDSKIKNCILNVDDRVLLFNSRLKIFLGKHKTQWSRPFTITKVFPYGIVELSQPEGLNFKVNGHRVKHYFGWDIPQLVVPDLQTFAMDK